MKHMLFTLLGTICLMAAFVPPSARADGVCEQVFDNSAPAHSVFSQLNGVGITTAAGQRLAKRTLGPAGRRLFRGSGGSAGSSAGAAKLSDQDEVQPRRLHWVDPRDLVAQTNTDGVAPGVYRQALREKRLRTLLQEIDPDVSLIHRRTLPSGRVQYFAMHEGQQVVFAPHVLELYGDLIIGTREEIHRRDPRNGSREVLTSELVKQILMHTIASQVTSSTAETPSVSRPMVLGHDLFAQFAEVVYPIIKTDVVRYAAVDFMLNEAWTTLRDLPNWLRELDALTLVLGAKYLHRLYADIVEQMVRHHHSDQPVGEFLYTPARVTEMTILVPVNGWHFLNVQLPWGKYHREVLKEPAFVEHAQRLLKGEEVTPDPELMLHIASFEIRSNRYVDHRSKVHETEHLSLQGLEDEFPSFFSAMRDLGYDSELIRRALLSTAPKR